MTDPTPTVEVRVAHCIAGGLDHDYVPWLDLEEEDDGECFAVVDEDCERVYRCRKPKEAHKGFKEEA